MKRTAIILLMICTIPCFAQEKNCSTEQFIIKGAIKNEITISFSSLDSFTVTEIPDVIITNHLGEKRSEAKKMKGVLMKDILQKALINVESPKQLSEFYFVFQACDGYKIVYSWNEIFNTETGNHIFWVTEKNGSRGKDLKEKMLTITPTDFKTGRRYIKGLSSITINRVQ